MVRLRVCLTLALALLLLGIGGWTPANHTAVPDSLAPEGLVGLDWQTIQSQVDKFTAIDGLIGMEFRNSLAINSNKPVDSGTLHVDSITMAYKASGYYFNNIFADVWVVDQAGDPVKGAMVRSEWYRNEKYLWEQYRNTDKNGHTRLGLSTGVEGTWQVCVVGVEKPGWSVDDINLPWCEWIYVP